MRAIMPAHANLRVLATIFVAYGALAGVAPAVAQDDGWGWSDTPRQRPRPPVRAQPWYDEPAYDEGRALRRYRRWDSYDRPWRYRRYEPVPQIFRDDADDPDFAPRSRRAPEWNRERPQDDGNDNWDTDSRDGAADDGGRVTASGGARPDIAPKAPPVVPFTGGFKPGSIVIDTSARKLYLVRSQFAAFAYPIGVGRDGFSWTGTEKVSRVANWPDWYPPAEMRARKPELPEKMTGGLNNPLGAKAIYLGNTLYRIHGTNDPKSIGRAESSGCFRMLNAHVLHLAALVEIGAEVTVVRSLGRTPVTAALQKPKPVAAKPLPRATQRPVRQLEAPPRLRWERDPDPYYADENFDR